MNAVELSPQTIEAIAEAVYRRLRLAPVEPELTEAEYISKQYEAIIEYCYKRGIEDYHVGRKGPVSMHDDEQMNARHEGFEWAKKQAER